MTEVKYEQMPKPDNVRSGSIGVEMKTKRSSKNRNKRRVNPKLPHFKGKYEPLHGFIFDHTGPHQMNNNVKAHKELCEHAGNSCKHIADVRHLLETFKQIDLTKSDHQSQ